MTNPSTPTSEAVSLEIVAWEWRKRTTWFAGTSDATSFWSEWEPLVPPYMDARDFAKSDPANYELRPLTLHAPAMAAIERLEGVADDAIREVERLMKALVVAETGNERLTEENERLRREKKEAHGHFLHEHGSELNDAKKWAEWHEAQRLIEEEMPEGYRVTLECSPGDWSLRFTDPEGEDITIDDYESTASFIRDAVSIAKESEARAALNAGKDRT